MKSDARAATWTGLFVLLSCVALVAVTAVLGQKSLLFESQYRLRTTFSNVQGLATGAPVRLSGVQVGTVASIRLPQVPTEQIVTVELEVNTRYRDHIRRDSRIMIRSMGALGDKYVEITSGTREMVGAKDIIRGEEPIDFFNIADSAEQTLQEFTNTVRSLNGVLADVRKSGLIDNIDAASKSIRNIASCVDTGPGMAHSVLHDQSLVETLNDVKQAGKALRTMSDAVQNKQGVFGFLLEDKDVKETAALARQAMEHADEISGEIANGQGLMHRLVYDKQQAAMLDDLRLTAEHTRQIMTRIDQGEGSLGLLINDPAVWARLKLLLGGLQRSTILRYLVERSIESGAKGEAEAAQQEASEKTAAPASPAKPAPAVAPQRP